MAWRKWIVRGIVYGIVSVAATGAFAYQRYTNPGAVREQVIDLLEKTFPGAHISIDSARLRIFGGIQLNGLRLTRKDDPEKNEILQVPTAIIYHDKEKVLEGELALRKIELIRPRLRVRRERDGLWNLRNVMREPEKSPKTPFPAIVIHQGTLVLEDRSEHTKPTTLEIDDVSLTIINDPIPRVVIRGAANSDLLGKLQLSGSFDRLNHEAFVAFKATQIPLTERLLSRLPLQPPAEVSVGLQVNAIGSVEGKVSYQPNQPQPLYYDVHCTVEQGKVQHPRLASPLEELSLKLHCHNGALQLENLTAKSGTTIVQASGAAQLPHVEQEFEVQLDLKHVVLGKELEDRLPAKIRDLHEMFRPNGPTTIHVACAKHENQWVPLTTGAPSMVSLRPENVSLAFKGFPYPLEGTSGNVDYNLLNQRIDINLKAQAGEQPVILCGHWTGEGKNADVKFDIIAADIPLDDKLMEALSPNNFKTLREFGQSFHANGKVNVVAHIRHEPGEDFRNVFHLHFHDAAICWEQFPLNVKKVSGTVNIYPEYWEFHEFQGVHKDGHVLVHGKSIPKDDKHGISLEITGHNIPLDDELREALKPMAGLYKTWDTFNPTGNLYFTASIKRPSPDPNDLEVNVDARGCNAKPTFFQYAIDDITGKFRFHKMRLDITKLRAKHEQSLISMDNGSVDLDPRGGGGYYAKFLDLQVQAMRLDEEFVSALPAKLQTAVKALKLHDPVKVNTQVVISQPPETGRPPDVYWDGKVWLHGAAVTTGLDFKNVWGEIACIGRHNGRQVVGVDGNLLLDQVSLYDQPFKKVHAKFQMRESSPDVLLIGLKAPIFGGDIVGQMRVDFNSALRYELNLTASQINVAEFGRQNLGPKSQISGAAGARLYLTGMGNGIDTLDGNGAIDIRPGHLYNLPFLLDLLKFLGLHWPDRTAFEEFHTAYSIQGSRVNIQKLDLLGSAVSLSGKGEFDLGSKELKLDVYPLWGRVEQLLPASVRPLPTTLSKNLLTVEVRGKASSNPKDLKFHMKPLPIVIDPLLMLRDRVIGSQGLGAGFATPMEQRSPSLGLPPLNGTEPERNRGFRIWD